MTDDAPFSHSPFHTRYGFSRPESPGIALRIEPYEEICDRGVLRPTILVSAVDLVASLFVREIAGTDATFTSDLSLRAPCEWVPRRIDVRGEVMRSGKRLLTTAVRLEADGRDFAYGESTFARLPRTGDSVPRIEDLRLPDVIESNPLSQPLSDEVGIEIVDPAAGRVRLALRAAHRNPEGVLQGALVGLIVETAALALGDSRAETARIITELDLRYLAAARVGPIESFAWPIGSGEATMLRVELRDAGQQGRITTSALVRLAPAPHP